MICGGEMIPNWKDYYKWWIYSELLIELRRVQDDKLPMWFAERMARVKALNELKRAMK